MESVAGEKGSARTPEQATKLQAIPSGASILVKNGFYEGLEVCLTPLLNCAALAYRYLRTRRDSNRLGSVGKDTSMA